MSKYIDAEKLKAEIEKLSFNNCKEFGNGKDLNESFGGCDAYKKVLSIITTLQQEQPKVDLKEEFHRWLSKEKEEWGGEIPPYGDYGLFDIARHFYELGLNAKKEE